MSNLRGSIVAGILHCYFVQSLALCNELGQSIYRGSKGLKIVELHTQEQIACLFLSDFFNYGVELFAWAHYRFCLVIIKFIIPT